MKKIIVIMMIKIDNNKSIKKNVMKNKNNLSKNINNLSQIKSINILLLSLYLLI